MTFIGVAGFSVLLKRAAKPGVESSVEDQLPVSDATRYTGSEGNNATHLETKKLERVVAAYNQPILLHAVVIDQNSNAVAQATLSGQIRRWRVIPPFMYGSILDPWTAKTDSQGRVQYRGGKGESINIKQIAKDGEEFLMEEMPHVSFDTTAMRSGTVPTKENPLVLNVWRSLGKSALTECRFNADLPLAIDLYVDAVGGVVATQQLARTDFKISIRSSVDGKKDRYGFITGKVDSLEIIPFDGVIAEAGDTWLLEAPLEGYSNRVWRTEPRAYKPQPPERWRVPYYYLVRGQFYGSLVVTIRGPNEARDRNFIMVDVRSQLAVGGSRNLQRDHLLSDKFNEIERTKLSIESYRKPVRPGL